MTIRSVNINEVKHLYKQAKSILIWTRYYECLVKKNGCYFVGFGMWTELGFAFKDRRLWGCEVIGWREIGQKDINEVMQ